MQEKVIYQAGDLKATQRLGESLAKLLKGTETIGLVAPLGAGKTHFVKAIAQGLGIGSRILSPTFVLERIYKVPGKKYALHHFDVYRITANEALGLGITDLFGEDIVVVEWADKIKSLMPTDTLWIEIKVKNENTREFKLTIPEAINYIHEGLR